MCRLWTGQQQPSLPAGCSQGEPRQSQTRAWEVEKVLPGTPRTEGLLGAQRKGLKPEAGKSQFLPRGELTYHS